jgi:iron complex transport system permease protein
MLWVRGNRGLILASLSGLLVLTFIAGAAIGPVSIGPLTIIRILLDKLPWVDLGPVREIDETILFAIRFPRVLSAALVGASLATGGVIFQGLLRNPMADPYFIGTSAGAAVGATAALLLPLSVGFLGFGLVPVLAFIGALTAVLVVYSLARVDGKAPVITLLLAGFVVSSLLIAVMTLLITINERVQINLRQLLSFLMGGFGTNDWAQLAVVTPMIIFGLVASRFYAQVLDAFTLGEEGASYLGIQVEREKLILIGLGALLTGAAVSLSGLVGFVGLMVPHAVRMVVGPSHRIMVPASAIAGAAFLVSADLLARVLLAPTEIPVGVLTALLGAPVFLYLLRRGGRQYVF